MSILLKKKIESILSRSLPPRPANYFDLEGFKEITRELLTEQTNRDVYMHLIRDSQGAYGRKNQFKCLRE